MASRSPPRSPGSRPAVSPGPARAGAVAVVAAVAAAGARAARGARASRRRRTARPPRRPLRAASPRAGGWRCPRRGPAAVGAAATVAATRRGRAPSRAPCRWTPPPILGTASPPPDPVAPQPPITVYVRPGDPQCAAVLQYLQQRGLAHTTRDVLSDPSASAVLFGRLGKVVVPVLQVGERLLVGYAPVPLPRSLPATREEEP